MSTLSQNFALTPKLQHYRLKGYRSSIEHLGISSIGAPPGNAPRSCAARNRTDAMPNVEPAYRQAYSSVVGRLSTLERHLADLKPKA